MGEEDLTKEEQEILGEESEEEKGTGTQDTSEEKGEKSETEQITESAEEKEAREAEEAQQAEEKEKDNLIPQSRLNEMRKEKGDVERKLDLLRRDPEEYYKKYPDEKLAELEEEKPLTTPQGTAEGIWDLAIQGGPYDGQRLGDVYDQGGQAARYALGLYNTERDSIRTQSQEAESRNTALLQQSQTEINDFVGTLAGDFFNKKPDELSDEESQQISTIIDETLDWMKETNRGSGVIGDAYFLKNKEKILAGEQIKGISSLIKGSQTIGSVSNKKDTNLKTTGYEGDISMNADDLSDKIDGMTDDQFAKYKANAPQKLKDKFPEQDW